MMADFNIQQVAEINSLQRIDRKGVGANRTPYICPFCGDKKGRFTISVTAGRGNVYKCFHCDAAGGMIKLHKELNHFSCRFFVFYKKIICFQNIIFDHRSKKLQW